MKYLNVARIGCSRAGFTLLELLTVITVIGVLIAVTVPMLGMAQVAANRTKCMSNQRQIGLALHLYANDNNGEFPPTMHSTSSWRKEESWVFELAPYLNNVDEVRVCPSDESERRERILSGGYTSYVLNDQVFDNYLHNTLQKIPLPSETLLLSILSSDKTPSTGWDHIHGAEWNSWSATTNDIEPDRHRSGARSADRTKGSSNYLYADGHVESISAKAFKALIDRGINPALVPTE